MTGVTSPSRDLLGLIRELGVVLHPPVVVVHADLVVLVAAGRVVELHDHGDLRALADVDDVLRPELVRERRLAVAIEDLEVDRASTSRLLPAGARS
jgi:hypothetical protein